MAISSPVILLPTGGEDYATDVSTQTLSGTTSTDTKSIQVNGSTLGVSYTSGEAAWAWTGDITLGSNTLNVVAIDKTTLVPSIPATITITLVQSSTFITVSPPTGVRLREFQDKIEIIASKNPEPQTIGYNFYVSTSSGGINNVYAKVNTALITAYSFFDINTRPLNTNVDTAGNIRVTTITEEINRVYFYSTFFDQTIYGNLSSTGQIAPITFSEDSAFFFVVSAVIYDTVSGQVTESAFSAEMQGSPVVITTGIRDLPARTQSDILLTFSNELLAADQGIDTKPGTVIRDEMNPVSEESARYYIIQDFLARALSVSAMLDFDDANGDGVSDPVSSSVKKKQLQVALNLQDPNDVQTLIDEQFDKLGSNVNVLRGPATPATGTVIFYVTTPPVRDMYVYEGATVSTVGDMNAGIPSENYSAVTTKILDFANAQSFFNTVTARYELSVDVTAVVPGSVGNTDSYTIKTINNGADSDFQVENPNPISFGSDKETNHLMAGRIQLALFTDTGTEGGYVKTTIAVPGVHNVRVEKAGDPLMMRDFDTLRLEHIGGKVDIYIQGERMLELSDQIAFEFGSVASQGLQTGEIFQVINANAFQFKSTNPQVTAHTPIFEVDRVTNSTRGADYDITGYTVIGNGDTIELDSTRPVNASVGLASSDIIRVDYKFRSSDTFILSHQPVAQIVSVTGQISGELPPANWELVKLQDPLQTGNSTIAQDGVRILFVNNLPVTGFQTITDEPHVMVVGKNENLRFLGSDPESIIVKNTDKTVTYIASQDYRIIPGTDTTPTALLMIESGSIQSGQQVLISYTAIENFTIVYTTNALLGDVQTEVDKMKHACADVVVKQAVENSVDFVMTVIPKTGVSNLSFLTSKIKTAISNYVSQLDLGVSLTQSEVISLIQTVSDVAYVIVPFNRMAKADGSFIARDDVGKTQWQVYNTGVVNAYITAATVLAYKTVDQGGSSNMFRGVFENSLPLVLQIDPLDVSGGAGRAYIRADGKLIVSTKNGSIPDNNYYQASYFVYGETGSNDINVSALEYLTVGNFTIIYGTPESTQQVL